MLWCVTARWLEKLGLSAREGVSVVIRQVLYGHNYGLLDPDLNPNPVKYLHLFVIEIFSLQIAW